MRLHDLDWDRLNSYVTGEGTPEERAALERWIESDPELMAIVAAMRSVGRPESAGRSTWDTRSALDRVHRRMRWAGPPRQFSHRSNRWRALAMAAIVLLAVGVSIVTLEFMQGRVLGRAKSTSPALATREITAPRGQRAAFALPDGTRIMLDADSRLRVPAGYSTPPQGHRGSREVFLIGRAFFQVTHDSTKPFRVRTATGIIDDIGTAFVVTAFPEQPHTEVVVSEGVVAVRAASATASPEPPPLATLRAGYLALIDTDGLVRLNDRVDVKQYLAWTEGRHVFRRTPVAEVIAELERSFDVEIVVTDPATLTRQFTADFGQESFSQVLDVLVRGLGLTVEQVGRGITLRPRSPASQ